MDLHFLMTTSGDSSALMGVRFVSGFFDDKARVRFTVFTTAPAPPALWQGEVNHASLQQYEARMRANQGKGRRIVDDALKMLVDAGFPKAGITTKAMVREVSRAEDILHEGEAGLYDALVMGRRGAKQLEDLMDESVSDQLAFRNAACPLWVCRAPERERSGVLLCLDGSDASMRTADHVGFVVAGLERHHVTLARVRRNGQGGDESTQSVFARARDILMENKMPPQRIHEKELCGTSVPKLLLAEARDGGYAAVAIGRTGRGQSLLRRLFMGSVGRTLLHELEGAVLWMRS